RCVMDAFSDYPHNYLVLEEGDLRGPSTAPDRIAAELLDELPDGGTNEIGPAGEASLLRQRIHLVHQRVGQGYRHDRHGLGPTEVTIDNKIVVTISLRTPGSYLFATSVPVPHWIRPYRGLIVCQEILTFPEG